MDFNKIKNDPASLDNRLGVEAALAEIINKETIKEQNDYK